jgi:hypothetical protein
MTGATKGERQREWINAAIDTLTPKDAWKTHKIESIYKLLVKLSPTTQFTLLRLVVKKTKINLTDAKAHFKIVCTECARDEETTEEEEEEPTTASTWYQEKDDAGWWNIKRVISKQIDRIDSKTGAQTQEFVDEVISYVLNYRVIGKAENNASRVVYLAEDNSGCFDVIDPEYITTQLTDMGTPDMTIREIKRFLATTPVIKNVPAYGFDQQTFRQFYLPPQYYAKGMMGLGASFIRYFKACNDVAITDKAVAAYIDIIREVAKNVGEANTYALVGFTMASLGRDYVIEQINIMPIIHCKGTGGKGKTSAVKTIANVGNLPKEIQEENAETVDSPAVFSQTLSAGYYPLVVEEPQGDTADVFKKIMPILLQLATTPYSRRRLMPQGHIRDDITAYRSPIIISNFDVTSFNDPQASSRIIELLFDHIKKDHARWAKLTHAYNSSGGSILAWMALHVSDPTFPDLKVLFTEAWQITNVIGKEHYKDVEDRSHLKVIPIIWGLYIFQTLFHYFDSDATFQEVVKNVYKICNALSPGGRVAVNVLVGACSTLHERFLVWEADHKRIDSLTAEIKKKQEDIKATTNTDDADKIDNIITGLNNLKRSLMREATDLQSKGLCRTISIRGTEWYVVCDDILPKLKKEMGEVNFSAQTKSQLRAFLLSLDIPVEGRPVHIPWLSLDANDVTQTKYAICFPVKPFIAPEDLVIPP